MSDSSFVYRTPVEARANVEAKPAPPFRGLTTARTAVSVSKSTAAGVGGLGAW
jgi:hypothetical protein